MKDDDLYQRFGVINIIFLYVEIIKLFFSERIDHLMFLSKLKNSRLKSVNIT